MSYSNDENSQSIVALDESIKAIQQRMEQWGGSHVWLDESAVQETRKCFSDFYRYFGKKELKDLEIDGWECGLGQILNLKDSRICKVLPFILTAYMYNFSITKNEKFVRGFIKRIDPSYLSHNDDFFFGGKAFDGGEDYGIGGFLNGSIKLDSRVIEEFAKRFRFPETKEQVLQTGFGEKSVYIIPAEKEIAFSAGIKGAIWIDDGVKGGNKVKYYTPGEDMKKYEQSRFFDIFLVWYHVLKLAANPVRRQAILVCSPDPVSNFRLIQSALHLNAMDVPNCEIENCLDCAYKDFKDREKWFISYIPQTDGSSFAASPPTWEETEPTPPKTPSKNPEVPATASQSETPEVPQS